MTKFENDEQLLINNYILKGGKKNLNNVAEIFIYLNMNVSNLVHLDETDRFFFRFEFCTFSSSIFFRHTALENLNIRNEILPLNASDFAHLDETDIFFPV